MTVSPAALVWTAAVSPPEALAPPRVEHRAGVPVADAGDGVVDVDSGGEARPPVRPVEAEDAAVHDALPEPLGSEEARELESPDLPGVAPPGEVAVDEEEHLLAVGVVLRVAESRERLGDDAVEDASSWLSCLRRLSVVVRAWYVV